MILNNIKIILRNIKRDKLYSLIKIGGFAIGIATCLLISLFIVDELSYDKHFKDGERIFRLVVENKTNGRIGVYQQAPIAKTLKENFPEVEEVGRLNISEIFGAGSNEIRVIGEVMNSHEKGFAYVDQGLLNTFNFPMIYGDQENALNKPNTIVISKRKADKYFPGENPVGKTLIINNNLPIQVAKGLTINNFSKPYQIGGVIDFSENSHFQYDFLLTLEGVEFWPGEQDAWYASNYHTYVKLVPGTDVSSFESKLSDIVKKYIIPSLGNERADNTDEILKSYNYQLQPLNEIHLKSKGISDNLEHGDIRFIWIFGIIAGFVLLIACINFINLSTAKSFKRAKEVGLRKTIGSNKKHLVGLFLTESIIYSFISVVLGIIISIVILPYFNTLTLKTLIIPYSQLWWIVPLLVSSSIIIGVLAGLYPALYLTSFKPVSVLKGEMSNGSKNTIIRNGLVTFQYAVSIVLIAATFTIYRQMGYILNKNIGFDKDQVVLLHGTQTMGNQVPVFKNELLKLSHVKKVTVSDYLPVSGTKRNGYPFINEGKTKEEGFSGGQLWQVDKDYIGTLGMNLVVGNDFAEEMTENSKVAVINETMVRDLRLDNPVGKRISNGNTTYSVIGVVEDFHFESLRENIRGICLILGNSPNIVSVKVSGTEIEEAIQKINSVWEKFSTNQPLRYTFLDENFSSMYADVKRTGSILSSFALLAVIVACLGLFALSSYMIEQRTKEIGIRKVNGARIFEVIALLNKDFLIWVIVAFIISLPLSYYAMHKWLENFAYKTGLSWWIFALAGLLALGIALLTVSWQSWRAATRNPVEALRYE